MGNIVRGRIVLKTGIITPCHLSQARLKFLVNEYGKCEKPKTSLRRIWLMKVILTAVISAELNVAREIYLSTNSARSRTRWIAMLPRSPKDFQRINHESYSDPGSFRSRQDY